MPILSLNTLFYPFLAVVFMAVGFWGTLYYQEHPGLFGNPVYSTDEILRTRALSHRLRQVEYENINLESQITELNLRMAHYYQDSEVSEVKTLTHLVGLIQQEGPGLEVTLKDSARPLLLGDNPNTGIVHNTDLVQVVNDLRAAGATSISINDQPVTTLTGISCSGPIILINGTRIASPFTIEALGDSEKLETYLKQPTSFIKELQKYGIEVSITPKDVSIPAATVDTMPM